MRTLLHEVRTLRQEREAVRSIVPRTLATQGLPQPSYARQEREAVRSLATQEVSLGVAYLLSFASPKERSLA